MLLLAACLCIAGCEGLTGERIAEIEAERTLRNIAQIRPVEDPNITLPEKYKAPPTVVRQMVGGAPEYKLLYFARYHTPTSLKQMIDEQFANRIYAPKGKIIKSPAYITSVNPACNQLVVRCPNEPDIASALELLNSVDVPPIQVKIDCVIYEMYADVTMDRETTILVENFLGEGITMGGKIDDSGDLLPAFPGAALREAIRSTFGLKVGFVRGKEGHQVRTLIDILESKGYLKIMLNPTLEVVNGKPARIVSKEKVPWETISLGQLNLSSAETVDPRNVRTTNRYVWIVDQLTVTPHVFADGSIALATDAMISSKQTPEGVAQTPVITKRQISNRENRIRQGESLVIGGIRKSERRAVVRGVPGLKDIPVIGLFFSSKDFEERAKETVFVLTPTISTGGVPNKDMVERLRAAHEPPVPTETLHDAVADPFGFKAGQRQEQRELLEAEQAVLNAEKQRAIAQTAITAADSKARSAQDKASRVLAELERTKKIARQMTADALKAKAEAEQMLKRADAARAQAARNTGDATRIRAEAEKLTLEAQAAMKKAEAKAQAAEAAMARVKAAEKQAEKDPQSK